MNRNYMFEWGGNSAKNFFILESDLKRIAIERQVAPQEVIQEFISDLENRGNPDYEVKVEELNINGIVSQKFIMDAKKYFSRVIKGLEKTQKNEKQRVKAKSDKEELELVWESVREFIEVNKELTITEVLSQIKEKSIFLELSNGQRKIVIRRTEKLIEEEAKKEALRKVKIEKTWKEVCEIVERESYGTGFTKPQYWMAIRDKVLQEENVGIKLDKSIQEYILELIDAKICDEKELLYYNQVKYFTEDFSFLAAYPEIQVAINGRNGRKFTDRESFDRFYELRASVQQGRDEYSQILKILKVGNIDETSRKILSGRIKVIEQQKRNLNNYFGFHDGR